MSLQLQWQEGESVLGKGTTQTKGKLSDGPLGRSRSFGDAGGRSGLKKQWRVHAVGGPLPSVIPQLALPPAEAQGFGFVGCWLGDFIAICHCMAFMTTLWSQMRDTTYHKGLFFMSYWAPSNSCMLFTPLTLLLPSYEVPHAHDSARRCQAVQWVKVIWQRCSGSGCHF